MIRTSLFLILLLFVQCDSQKAKPSAMADRQPETPVISGQDYITQLVNLNYFDLTDSSEVDSAQLAYRQAYETAQFLQGKLHDEDLIFTDNRYFWVDCEELFERGGLKTYLDHVKPTFERLGIPFQVANEISSGDTKTWDHTIELNGTQYVAFQGTFTDTDWSIAYINFIEMLNAELQRHHSEERFYPIRCGNDGSFVLLSPQQFQFLDRVLPKDGENPVTIATFKLDYVID